MLNLFLRSNNVDFFVTHLLHKTAFFRENISGIPETYDDGRQSPRL